jgi:hypothetical protein
MVEYFSMLQRYSNDVAKEYSCNILDTQTNSTTKISFNFMCSCSEASVVDYLVVH